MRIRSVQLDSRSSRGDLARLGFLAVTEDLLRDERHPVDVQEAAHGEAEEIDERHQVEPRPVGDVLGAVLGPVRVETLRSTRKSEEEEEKGKKRVSTTAIQFACPSPKSQAACPGVLCACFFANAPSTW